MFLLLADTGRVGCCSMVDCAGSYDCPSAVPSSGSSLSLLLLLSWTSSSSKIISDSSSKEITSLARFQTSSLVKGSMNILGLGKMCIVSISKSNKGGRKNQNKAMAKDHRIHTSTRSLGVGAKLICPVCAFLCVFVYMGRGRRRHTNNNG